MSILPKLVVSTVFLLSVVSLSAAPKFYGSARYQFSSQNTMVTFGCGGINNPSKENATGTIQVKLWAVSTPYSGGSISGRVLGEYKLSGLNPGAYYSPVSKTLKTSLPTARKHYYLVLTLAEYRGGSYGITDYRNFDSQVLLGPVDLFSLTGPWSWAYSTEGGTLDISVAKITHTRSGNTGSLRLGVWATSSPYRGGGIEGYQLGYVNKAALKPGYSYSAVKNVAKYKKPPAGTYHLTLVLMEFSGTDYKIVDYLSASSTHYFK
jgi:hypothetical protein